MDKNVFFASLLVSVFFGFMMGTFVFAVKFQPKDSTVLPNTVLFEKNLVEYKPDGIGKPILVWKDSGEPVNSNK